MINRFLFYPGLVILLLFTSCRKQEVSIQKYDYKSVGSAAHDYLSNSYNSLVIEISYMPGYAPSQSSMDNLTTFLNNYLNKPGGISIVQKQIQSSGKSVLTLNEVADLEKANRTQFTSGTTLAAHILIADADYDKDSILGVSYWNTSICLFGKTIAKSSGGFGQVNRALLYSILMDHEFGHLLGLVDQGSPMVQNHKDPAHGPHCSTRSCLMFYGINTGATVISVPPLDAFCISDLKANGGK